jgi:plasmid stabilization system protein ParE
LCRWMSRRYCSKRKPAVMPMVKFFPQAEARLIGIWDDTLEKWDEAQADEYVSELVAEIGMSAFPMASGDGPRTARRLVLPGIVGGRHRGHHGAARERIYRRG